MAPTPEEAANDLEQTRIAASETSALQFSKIVADFAVAYEKGQLAEIWAARCAFGISVAKDQMSEHDWFWFQAYPALAGLKLRKMPGFPLDNFCAQADRAATGGSTDQEAVKHEINKLYFGA